MKTLKVLALLAMGMLLVAGCTSKKEKMNQELKTFIHKHDSMMIPLFVDANLASWNASVSGKAEDYKKLYQRSFNYKNVFDKNLSFLSSFFLIFLFQN